MALLARLTVLAGVVSLWRAAAHPTRYPGRASDINCSAAPAVLSYHIHVVFALTTDQIAAATALRDAARAHFQPYLGADCTGRYDNGRLCLIFDHDINSTLDGGPFPAGEWSMFTPVTYVAPVLAWFTAHYVDTWPSFSLLLHTNTGEPLARRHPGGPQAPRHFHFPSHRIASLRPPPCSAFRRLRV